MTEQVTMVASAKHKNDQVKRQLLVAMTKKRQDLMQKFAAFMKNDLHEKQDYVMLAKGIVADVDSVLNENDYESSLFLRNTVKPLKQMREEALSVLALLDEQDEIEKHFTPVLKEDMVPVYVLVFQQQGHNLAKWAQLLRGLSQYVLGRPIYATEADVRKVIRTKMTEDQEGYVKVAIDKAILEKCALMAPRKDRYGNTLLSLPAGTVSSHNILEFVQGKKCYHFNEGELIDVSSTTKRN